MTGYLKTFTLQYGIANITRLRTFIAGERKQFNDNSSLQLIKPRSNLYTSTLLCQSWHFKANSHVKSNPDCIYTTQISHKSHLNMCVH